MRRSVGWYSTDCTRGWCTRPLVSLCQYYQLVSGSLAFISQPLSLIYIYTHTEPLIKGHLSIRETWFWEIWFCPILIHPCTISLASI